MKHAQHVTAYEPRYNGHNYASEKPLLEQRSLVVKAKRGDTIHDGSGLRTLITVRIHGTQARNFASIWVHADEPGMSCAGYGMAGGYGYHRPSAALQVALDRAGIKLAQPIDGYGDQAITDAMLAIARHLGYSKGHIV